MSILDGLRRNERRRKRGWIWFWLIIALWIAFVLGLAWEFPELAVIVP